MFGLNESKEKKFNERSHFNPISPYSIAKLSAYYYVKMYRNSYNIFASNGILFNHESPLRGDHFVTKKIIKALVKISIGEKKDSLKLGNIYSRRDWGHAKDYAEMMYKILIHKKPDDFVISSGHQHSIKEFVNIVCKKLDIKITWKGKGFKEKAFDKKKNIVVEVSRRLFRPQDVVYLLGDSSKAKKILKWKPNESIDDLIDDMIEYEKSIINVKN
jgi:GDPmannose 4,6-dehydratase